MNVSTFPSTPSLDAICHCRCDKNAIFHYLMKDRKPDAVINTSEIEIQQRPDIVYRWQLRVFMCALRLTVTHRTVLNVDE